MHWILERAEKIVDAVVPYALIALLALIIIEFTTETVLYQTAITIIDETILAIFIVDLCFKYYHVKNTMQFFKTYWIELIAVFPFYLVIRTYTALVELSRGVEETQRILHEAALIREARVIEEARTARIIEEEARFLREARFFRTIRFFQRIPRLLFARLVFAKKLLLHAHHRHKNKK